MLSSATFKKNPIKDRYKDKVVLVTGGTSGIGEATVKRFHSEGAFVAFTGRRKELGMKLETEMNQVRAESGFFIECDHTKEEECRKSVRAVVEKWGKLDVLVNNAGVVTLGSFEETDTETYHNIMHTNQDTVWYMCQSAIPQMTSQEDGGVIVNNASDWGLVGASEASAYCMSKASIVMLTKCLALEYAKRNIRVCAVCPGDTFVPRWMDEARESGEYPKQEFSDSVLEDALRTSSELPMGRTADVAEIAAVISFLASDDASYMTGCAIPVDGGNSAK